MWWDQSSLRSSECNRSTWNTNICIYLRSKLCPPLRMNTNRSVCSYVQRGTQHKPAYIWCSALFLIGSPSFRIALLQKSKAWEQLIRSRFHLQNSKDTWESLHWRFEFGPNSLLWKRSYGDIYYAGGSPACHNCFKTFYKWHKPSIYRGFWPHR